MARPEDVLAFTEPTSGFLCPLEANVYQLEFLQFSIRDADSRKKLFEVNNDSNEPVQYPDDFDFDLLRTVSYTFSPEFLRLNSVSTTLVFRVGPQPVRNLRMIERHYFRNRLIKSFDFSFPLCIPNSTNEWESIYEMPKISDAEC